MKKELSLNLNILVILLMIPFVVFGSFEPLFVIGILIRHML